MESMLPSIIVSGRDETTEGTVTISDYCLYWLMTIREYVRYTGDSAIVAELYPGVERALAWFERFIDHDKLLNNLPHWLFVDWAQVDKRGQCTVINAQYVHTLKMCAELAEVVGLPARAEAWRALAAQVTTAINRHLWDEARGVYVDSRDNGVQSRRVSQHANGICLAYAIAPSERQASITRYITDPRRVKLTATGMGHDRAEVEPFDEGQDITLAQPFFSHHLHWGLIQAGEFKWVLDNIRQRWGAMLAAGSSTIWELWSPLASQCHAWSTTPTYDLSTHVLGIYPLANGFAQVFIAPQIGDLAWAEGNFPTPYGNIRVAWQWKDQRFKLMVEIPQPNAFEVLLPVIAAQVEVNGQLAWAAGEANQKITGLSLNERASGNLMLLFEQGGAFTIQAASA